MQWGGAHMDHITRSQSHSDSVTGGGNYASLPFCSVHHLLTIRFTGVTSGSLKVGAIPLTIVRLAQPGVVCEGCAIPHCVQLKWDDEKKLYISSRHGIYYARMCV